MILLYNILFPVIFILFLPGLLLKLIRRPGYKSTFMERFSCFSSAKKALLKKQDGVVWIHSVSVGETVVALSMINKWLEREPQMKFVLSTTTTTGQELAQGKAPDSVIVIFCPIDWFIFVRRTLALMRPAMLVIFETEIWPNLICEASKQGARVAMVNARLSDNSIKGYTRFKKFIAPILQKIDLICVQSEMDKKRFESLSPNLNVSVPGNLKFDQTIPTEFPNADLEQYFGKGDFRIILAASTHSGEEKLIASAFKTLRLKYDDVRLIIVPRHAERGKDIEDELLSLGVTCIRKTEGNNESVNVDCLLADTTGEMLMFINSSDIVVMGKSFAGHDGGHNLIEPALMGKPIVTGSVLKNFRFVLNVLKHKEAIITIDDDCKLESTLEELLISDDLRKDLGHKARFMP